MPIVLSEMTGRIIHRNAHQQKLLESTLVEIRKSHQKDLLYLDNNMESLQADLMSRVQRKSVPLKKIRIPDVRLVESGRIYKADEPYGDPIIANLKPLVEPPKISSRRSSRRSSIADQKQIKPPHLQGIDGLRRRRIGKVTLTNNNDDEDLDRSRKYTAGKSFLSTLLMDHRSRTSTMTSDGLSSRVDVTYVV